MSIPIIYPHPIPPRIPEAPKRKEISFEGYNSPLKKNWRKGKLPTVRKGFYGDTLTQENVSLEHLLPRSQGGPTTIDNLVLASVQKNNARGVEELKKSINKQAAAEYLLQFIGINLRDFNGNKYIEKILRRLKSLGIDLSK